MIILQCYQSANSVPVHTLPSFSLRQALTTGIKTFKEAVREIRSQFDMPIVRVEPFDRKKLNMNQIDVVNYFLETIGDHSYPDPDQCD